MLWLCLPALVVGGMTTIEWGPGKKRVKDKAEGRKEAFVC